LGLSLCVYRDLQHLDQRVAEFWTAHQWHPFGNIDWVKHEYRVGKERWEPYIVAIRDQEKIISCAVGKIMLLPLKLQFGYKVVAGPRLTTLVIHLSGLIGRWQPAHYALIRQHWREILDSRVVDSVHARGVPLTCPLHEIAAAGLPFLRRGHFEVVQEYWLITQLQSCEVFFGRHPNLRKHFRYYRNRLNRVFPGKVEIRLYHEPDPLEPMLGDSEKVGRETWQRRLGQPSFLEPEERSHLEFHFARGWYRGFVLYFDHVPVAFVHGIICGKIFYVLKLGYHPAFRNLSVGTYLLLHVIEEFSGNDNIHILDFNVGNSEAKRLYCDCSYRVSDIHLFAAGSRLWVPILLRLAAQGCHELAKAISHRWGFYQWIRHRWRHSDKAATDPLIRNVGNPYTSALTSNGPHPEA